MKETKKDYVICVRAEESADIEIRKVYEVLPDDSAEKRGYLRVVDESGEDYLYLVHSHQHFEGTLGGSVGAMMVTSTGAVSAGSPFGFTPRFSPADLTPPRPVVPLGVGGYLEKLRF
jgi:hypothetical protein